MTSRLTVTKFFEENITLIRAPTSDPLNYNLNSGLAALTKFIEGEFNDMKSKMNKMERDIRDLQHQIQHR